jgi:uncharacterized membrane protein YbhN (UPF0104 family)
VTGSSSAAPAVASGSPTPQVQVVESWPARVHRPLDLIRLGALVAVLLVLVGLAVVGRDTSRAVNADLARLLGDVPTVFIRLFRLLSAFGALGLPLGLMVREVVRGYARRLIEALVTGLLAIGIAVALDHVIAAFPSSALFEALTHLPGGVAARPLDSYLAALFAFAAVVGVADEPVWRRLLGGVATVYVLAAFTSTQASLQSLILSATLGVVVGIAVRYAAGSVNERPTGHRIAAALAQRNLPVVRLEAAPIQPDDHRVYQGITVDGDRLQVLVFDRELVASGAVFNLYRVLRLRAELAPAPALSLERVTEHRSLLALAAQAAGVRTPRLLAGLPCGPDSIVLVYELPAGGPLRAPGDHDLDALWGNVNRLHHARVTHRGLTAEGILQAPDGAIVLPIPVRGAMFANDLRVSLDRVQLLITTAQLAGVERAVASARRNLRDDELLSVLPVLQPIALPSSTRAAIKARPGLLTSVRDEIAAQTAHQAPELINVERLRPRTIVSIVALIVAGYLIVGQLGSVHPLQVLALARWQWIPLVLLASTLTYVAAAVSLTGYVREKLSFARTVLTQLAASFAGFVTPPAVGGLALNVRYLQRAGVAATGIAASLGLSQVINAASHVVLLVAFVAVTGASTNYRFAVPGWAFGLLGVAALLVLLTLTVAPARHWLSARLLPPLRQGGARLLDLVTSPVKLAEGLLGALGLNVFYIAALWFSMHAFNGSLAFSVVAVVYLTAAVIGSVAPTPGGLGAVEVALSTGLAAGGMPSTAAVSAVLLFRLATFWLPVPLGWIALRYLRDRAVV